MTNKYCISWWLQIDARASTSTDLMAEIERLSGVDAKFHELQVRLPATGYTGYKYDMEWRTKAVTAVTDSAEQGLVKEGTFVLLLFGSLKFFLNGAFYDL